MRSELDLQPGVYLLRLRTAGRQAATRLTLTD
jgi:hypothetical protein